MNHLARIAAALIGGIMVYFSFRPDPHFRSLEWMPDWLVAFGDKNPDFRTFVPFFAFALLLPFLRPNRETGTKRFVPLGGLLLFGFLVLSESLQALIPTRTASWIDLLWGTTGILSGLTLSLFLQTSLDSGQKPPRWEVKDR